MKTTLSLTAVALVATVAIADAQTRLSRGEIISSLQGVQQQATLNPNDLRAQALQNIQTNPGENAPASIPMAGQLAKLPQFNVEINFDFDSDRIRPDSYETLGVIADALHTPYLTDQKFLVVGHTDAKGSRQYNLDLSQRRAEAVRFALVTTFRVPSDRVQAVGLGEEQLRDSGNPEAAINRRVQLINTGF